MSHGLHSVQHVIVQLQLRVVQHQDEDGDDSLNLHAQRQLVRTHDHARSPLHVHGGVALRE